MKADKPTIVVLRSLLTKFGGAEHTASLTAVALSRRQYPVIFQAGAPIDKTHPYYTRLRDTGIDVLIQPDLRGNGPLRSLLVASSPLALLPFAVLKRKGPLRAWRDLGSVRDHVLAKTEQYLLKSRLARLRRRGPLLVHVFGPESLMPHVVAASRQFQFPVIYTETTEADEVSAERFQLKWTIPVLPAAAAVICCSPLIAANMRRVYGYEGPIEEIPFLIEEPRQLPPRPEHPTLVIGCVGRMVEHKGFQFVVSAVAELRKRGRDVAAVIAGDGPMRETLQAQAAQAGVADRIHLVGRFGHVSDVMAQINVLVLPSSSEAQPLAITEAMSYGKAVVATRFGGIPDLVEDGNSGVLVPPGDQGALVAALDRLVQNRELVVTMGQRGRAIFESRLGEAAVVRKLEALYARVLEACPRG